MVTSFVSTARSYRPAHVITHIMCWSLWASLLLLFTNAYQSLNGAGILHWIALVAGIMGMTAQLTTLINETIEELS